MRRAAVERATLPEILITKGTNMAASHRLTIHERATIFRRLHDRAADQILVLPNAWDAASARLIEQVGARAIATTSSGVSWSLGRPDGEGLRRDEMIAALRRIVESVELPVTADVERGYGANSPADVAETVRQVLEAGAVGINLEDSSGGRDHRLLAPVQQSARIAAAREEASAAGVPLFVNARVDTYLSHVGDDAARFDETVRRAHAYVAAGADGIFVIGVSDAHTIGRLAETVGAPLNILAGPGSPSISELRALGVARVSVGAGIARAAMTQIRRVAHELLETGTYDALREGVPFPEANALFPRAG
jgi:2-methylisocitrate lyase-like PEP mutase family enzyme